MPKQTFQQLQTELQGYIGDDSPVTTDILKRILNDAQREVTLADDWWFRADDDSFNTKAPYTTGTISATKGSATLTITGGSFAGLAGYKFALSVSSPYYRIISVASNGLSATLGREYVETTNAAITSFLIYKDEYELPDVDSITAIKIIKAGYPELQYISQSDIDNYDSVPNEQGVPRFYYIAGSNDASASAQNLHIGLFPIPDDIYGVSYRFLVGSTDMSAPTDLPSLPESHLPAMKSLALYRAYTYDYQNTPEASQVYQEYSRQIEDLRRQTKATTVSAFQFKAAGHTRRYIPTIRHQWPA